VLNQRVKNNREKHERKTLTGSEQIFLLADMNSTQNFAPVSQKTYPIGTTFKPLGKNQSVCTVVDRLTTYNLAGEVRSVRYVATHGFCGQTITNSDVASATIARGFIA
jgi:hypothetical protein